MWSYTSSGYVAWSCRRYHESPLTVLSGFVILGPWSLILDRPNKKGRCNFFGQ
jgi:hypothetical protein